MAYEKQGFVDGQVLAAEHLNHMEDGIHNASDAHVTVTEIEGGHRITVTYKSTGEVKSFDVINNGGGGSSITVDSALSSSSTNPVQNKVVKTALDGKAPNIHTHSASDISKAGFLTIHPEYAGATTIPYIFNDLAFLTLRGGSISAYTTTSTDLTAMDLEQGELNLSGAEKLFNGMPSNAYLMTDGNYVAVLDLTLHKTFTYNNNFYIDFAMEQFRAKNIEVYVMNKDTESAYTLKGSITNNSASYYFCTISHSSKNSEGKTVQGFNKLRIVLSNFYQSGSSYGRRIAEIGLVNYASAGASETLISRGGCDGIYGNLHPHTNGAYYLGSSTKKWGGVFASAFNGELTAPNDSQIKFASGSGMRGTSSGHLIISSGGAATSIMLRPHGTSAQLSGVKLNSKILSPEVDKEVSLGSTDCMWNNLYLSGSMSDGENSIEIKDIARLDDIPKLGYDTPEMHGAIGDGVNDDAVALATAINSSNYVSLTSDLYVFTPIVIADKTHLVIDGNGYTINFKNIERALQISGSANIIFRNIIFDGNSCTTQGVLFIDCENIQVEKCTFKNMTSNSAAAGDTWGLNFRDSKNMRVDFCSFVNIDGSNNSTKVANGLVVHGHTKPCENVTISNCYFDTILPVTDACGITLSQTSFYDSPLYGVVENCLFVDCAKRAVKIMAQYVAVNHCNIVDVLSNEQHSSLIDIMASHCRVTNNTINVNRATNGISCQYVAETTLTSFSDIIIENNYINVANADSTTARDGLSIGIMDDPKKYTEVVVKNNVVRGRFRYVFKAMNISNSVIDGNTFEGESRLGNRTLNDKPCDNIRIVNNTIKGTFETSVTHSLLAYNEFTGGGFGIYFPTYTNGSPSNLRIIGNRFDNLSYGIDGRRQAMDSIIVAENIFTNIATYDMHLLGTNYIVEDNVPCKGIVGTYDEVYPKKTTTWTLTYEDGSSETVEVVVK